MSPAEIEDTLAQVAQTVKASAKRPVGTRTLTDRSTCTNPRCTCKKGRGR